MKLNKYLFFERLFLIIIIFIIIRNLTISINQSYLFLTPSDLDYYSKTGLISFLEMSSPNRYYLIPIIYLLYLLNIWNIILICINIDFLNKLKNIIEDFIIIYFKIKEKQKEKKEEIKLNKISKKKEIRKSDSTKQRNRN